MTESDVTADGLGGQVWDVAIIGAGLAGALSSYLLARRGLRTLLVEAKPFPRPKVCGGCLNERAISRLEAAGLGDLLNELGAQPFSAVDIVLRGRRVRLPVPPGAALTREPLDAAIVDRAKRAGATFLPSTVANVAPADGSPTRRVRMRTTGGEAWDARARVVLACDGLGHTSLSELPALAPQVSKGSRLGLGAILPASSLTDPPDGEVLAMVVGEQGYVGYSRCEEGLVSVAAAVDRDAMASGTPPAEVIASILRQAGLRVDDAIRQAPWRGTRPLSQASPVVAEERLLLLGDAAGYVEPFTGEGMAAALEGASLAAPLAERASTAWRPTMAQEWQATYTKSIRNHQKSCARLAWLLRRPRLASLVLRAVSGWPQLGASAARGISSRRTQKEPTAWAQQSLG